VDPDCDGIELKRPTVKEMDVQIVLMLDKRKSELLEIPKELATLTQSQVVNIPQFYRALCFYIKSQNLIFPDDASAFQVDPFLSTYFDLPVGTKQPLAYLIIRMRERFKQNGVITINHRLRFDEDSAANEQVYDIAVDTTDSRLISDSLPNGVEYQQASRIIGDLDKEISELSAQLKSHLLRESFLKDFAKNPLLTIKALLSTPPKSVPDNAVFGASWLDHIRDIKHADFYRQPWAIAAASQLLELAKKEEENKRR
jgi:hypothetical protein